VGKGGDQKRWGPKKHEWNLMTSGIRSRHIPKLSARRGRRNESGRRS